jgi:mRNA-degrading endonuclease RelE of RelBE toxin-antitoxin system
VLLGKEKTDVPMYEIEYTERALVDLQYLWRHEQNIFIDAIDRQLRFEPTVVTRNRKPLETNNTAAWELRVGDFRVFYDVADQIQIVAIERVGESAAMRSFFVGELWSLAE